MNKEKLIRIAFYGALFLVIFIAIYSMYKGPAENDLDDTHVDMGLKLAYYLTYIVVGVALLAFIYNIVKNFRESRGLVIGLGILLIIFGIGYSMATPDLLDSITDLTPTDADKKLSKLSGAGLKTSFILGIGTIAAAIYASLKNVFS